MYKSKVFRPARKAGRRKYTNVPRFQFLYRPARKAGLADRDKKILDLSFYTDPHVRRVAYKKTTGFMGKVSIQTRNVRRVGKTLQAIAIIEVSIQTRT